MDKPDLSNCGREQTKKTLSRDYQSLLEERAKNQELQSRVDFLESEISIVRRDLSAVVQSKIWRSTALLRQLLSKTKKTTQLILFRYRKLKLAPAGDLQFSDGRWEASSSNCHFDLSLPNAISPGWYKIKNFTEDSCCNKAAEIYFDYGRGFSEDNKLKFSSFGDQGVAVVQLRHHVYALKLCPIDKPARFSFNVVGLRVVSKFEVLFFYAKYYLRRQNEFGVSVPDAIKAKVAQLGGWRKLGMKQLLRQASTYEAMQIVVEEEDKIVSDYSEWVRHHEQPYFENKYSVPASTNIELSLVALTDIKGFSTLAQSIPQLSMTFSHVFTANPGIGFHCEEKSQLSHICFEDIGKLLAHILSLYDSVEGRYVCFSQASVVLGRYFVRAFTQAVEEAAKPPSFLYFDHDRYIEGERVSPHFKSEWDSDLYLSSNYIGPVCVFSLEYLCNIVQRLPNASFNEPVSLLVLAGFHHLNRGNVIRVPEIHYHEMPVDSENDYYALARSTINDCVRAGFLAGYETVQNELGERYIRPSMPSPQPSVSVVIPTKDRADLLKKCIDSIFQKTTYKLFDLHIIDNGSTEDDALELLSELAQDTRITVSRYPIPFNYSAINNYAVSNLDCDCDIVLFLNNDIEVITPGWIEEMVAYAIQPDIGCVGAKLYYANDTVQHAGVILGATGVGTHVLSQEPRTSTGPDERLVHPRNYTAVTGACLAIKKEILDSVGGLNEQDLAVSFNDVDLCLNVYESGYRNVWTPRAELYHHESVSRGSDDSPEKARRFAGEVAYIMQRWGRLLNCDPAYNPNLTLQNASMEKSTRYLSTRTRHQLEGLANPCEKPYYFESNIERINNVLTGQCRLHDSCARLPGLSIIILTLEKYELISGLLYSLVSEKGRLEKEYGLSVQIIVGDTGSVSEEVEALYAELADKITLVRNQKYHFSKCNNALFKAHAKHQYVLFLNNDIMFDDPAESLLTMSNHLLNHDSVGIVGTHLIYPTGNLQHGGVDVLRCGVNKGLCYHPGHNAAFNPPSMHSAMQTMAVTGACLMMSSNLFVACGYFDESYASEVQDVDLCFKAARCGFKTEIIYTGKIIHYENATRHKGDSNPRDRARFIRKWSMFEELLIDG